MIEERGRIYDVNLQLKDAVAVTASGAAQVGGSDKIIDLGDWTGVEGEVVIDISAILITDNDELYDVGVQVSSSATFASGIEEVASMKFGANEVLPGDVDTAVGRYFIKFSNEKADMKYRYIRLYTTVSGTTTSITYSAYIALDR